MQDKLIILDGVSSDHLQSVNDFIAEWNNDESTIRVETSGSTGVPKTIELDKEHVRISARATGNFFKFDESKKLLLALSPSYIAGKLMIVRAIEFGCDLLVAEPSANPLENEIEHIIDFAAFVPYQVNAMLEVAESRKRFASIKDIIIGGAPINRQLETELSGLQSNIYATFGMTETITHFALRCITKGEKEFSSFPGFELRATGNGQLIIHRHPYGFREITTNDIVKLTSPNSFEWVGRLDHVINSGAVKMHPEQIEEKIRHLMHGRRFYISGKKNDVLGEHVVLIVEGDRIAGNLLEELAEVLDKYEKPRAIIYRRQLGETATGKIIREKF